MEALIKINLIIMKRLPAFSHIQKTEKTVKKKFSPPQKSGITLAFIVMGLILFGLVMLYSTSTGTDKGAAFLIKQSLWILIGIICAALINMIGYKKILKYSNLLIILSCSLLVSALFSDPINGAYRWISLPGGFGNIQPSELGKMSVIIFLANYLPKHQRQLNYSMKSLLFPAAVCCAVVSLILLGRDLGTTIMLCAVIWLMVFAAGVRLKLLIPPLFLLPCIPFILKHYDKVRWVRITSFMNPEKFQQSTGYQLWLSILALGSGSWTGLGFAKSRMKAHYLPESHTDFILSIVGEELGYIAMVILILIYVLFLILAVFISTRAKDKDGMLLGFGITSMISMQAIINIGVVCGAFPTKGMPAPFISYGGSNMIMCLIGVGFLLSISNYKGSKSKAESKKNIAPDKKNRTKTSKTHV
ncbi:MAG: putative lipid II flippase FtsW [Victivallales bacterium]|nr:putative lipid II flippase FtsW [Victivallales bacterium]MCF7889285.1 putative lipid II flippase FtsW [Victivallales bacterium]